MAAAVDRQWRFNDGLAGPPRVIPEQWLDAGDHEDVLEGQARTFPVLMRVGTDLEWTVGGGNPYEGPHRDRDAIMVCYATVYGEQAHARVIRADRTDTGVRPRRFAALASIDRDALADVGVALQPLYRALIGAYCGDDVDPQTGLTAWRRDGVEGVAEVSPRA